MKPTHNVAYGQKYTTRDGSEKTRWTNHGVLMVDAGTGRMSLKLESVPVNFNGFLSLFPIEEKKDMGRTRDPLPTAQQMDDLTKSLPF